MVDEHFALGLFQLKIPGRGGTPLFSGTTKEFKYFYTPPTKNNEYLRPW
jgi:hypothetical protein